MNHFSLTPYAQNEAWNQLLSMKNQLPQALLCIGPSGVGKRRSIRALFQAVNCQNTDADPCGKCSQCKKIAENNHVDFTVIQAQGEQILIDDLREMKKMLHFAPIDSKFRFILIDEAHRLNTSSANSLLKILEEPPSHTHFFLTTHERNLILPTILSRSQFLYFAPLSPDAIQLLLEKMDLVIPKKHEHLLFELLSGGLARAQWLLQEDTILFLESCLALSESKDQIASFADKMASDEEKVQLMIDLFIIRSHQKLGTLKSEGFKKINDAYWYQNRLHRNANKKLISYLVADLFASIIA